jgi:hypothetical protein
MYTKLKNISKSVLGSRNSSAEYAEFVYKYLFNAAFHLSLLKQDGDC